MPNGNFIPHSEPHDWYLTKGNNGPRQWFSQEKLEVVLSIAVLMTGAGDMSGIDQVTLEDAKHNKLVTFVANEKHAGCSMVIPHESRTTSEDLALLKSFMIAHRLAWSVTEEREEEAVEQAE